MKRIQFAMFLIAVLVSATNSSCRAQTQQQLTLTEEASLRAFLQKYIGTPAYDYKATAYVAAATALRDHERDVIVYFTDRFSCGSGGCTTLILAPEGLSYRVVTSVTIGWRPIRVLDTSTKGWHDIGILVAGGGIDRGYEATLPFDGKSYPRNPSVPPARRSARTSAGEILISADEKAKPLY